MSDTSFKATMEHIISALQEEGYNPYDQLTGYIQTGNINYITRRKQARDLVRQLDIQQIKKYLETM